MQRIATIIGAGPSGSVAAILLARAGWKVHLIEQHRFPRDKVCGECLSALGIEVLRRIGIARVVESLNPVLLKSATLFDCAGRPLHLRLPDPMWGVSRASMDHALLIEARCAGVLVHQPARCESTDDGVRVRDLVSNEVRSLVSDWTLIADGKRRALSGDLGIKAHFTGVEAPGDTIALFGVRGHYIGLAPIEDNRWNIAFSAPAKLVRRLDGDLDALFANAITQNAALGRAMKHATRTSAWKSAPLPRAGVERQWKQGQIPLGNAAASLEPIGGEGMGLAMRSAELAAKTLIEADGAPDLAGLRSEFRKLWSVRSASCRALAIAMSHPVLSRIATSVASRVPGLTGAALRLTGK